MIRILLLLTLFSSLVFGQVKPGKFMGRERIIIYDIIHQYKKECGHVSLLDQSKLSEIQNVYTKNKDNLKFEQNECFEAYMSQIVGGHRIYKDLCDEVTPKKRFGNDDSLARVFTNIRRYEMGIRPYQEKLNDCLVRNNAPKEVLLKFPDYEGNLRVISKKVRELDTSLPFKENNLDLR